MRTGGRRAIDSQGASLGKAIGSLFLLGAGFAAITVALPHPSGGNVAGQLAIGGAMLVTGVTCWILAGRFPARLAHGLLIVAAAGAGGLIVAAGVAAGGYGSIFVWVVLVAGVFFPRRIALMHLGWILAVYAVTILVVESTAGYSPVTRWLSTAVSLTVVALLTTEIVQRRGRADMRARRFFDLSHDLLCTMDLQGRCVEVNPAWTQCLGYSRRRNAGPPAARDHPPRRSREGDHAGAGDLQRRKTTAAWRPASAPRTEAGIGCARRRRSPRTRSSSTRDPPT